MGDHVADQREQNGYGLMGEGRKRWRRKLEVEV